MSSVPSNDEELIARLSSAFAPFTSTVAGTPPVIHQPDTADSHKYLEALRKNQAAQQAYRDAANASGSKDDSTTRPSHGLGGSPASLVTHLELLRLRRQHRNLGTLQHYVTAVTNEADEDLDLRDPSAHGCGVTLSSASETDMQRVTDLVDQAKQLTQELEVAVLQAQHAVNYGKRLLAETRARSEAGGHPISVAARIHAVNATRDELVRWMDDKLSVGGTDNSDLSSTSISEHLGEWPEDVTTTELYNNYTKARRTLLGRAKQAGSSLPTQRSLPAGPPRRRQGSASTSQREPSLIPFLERQIIIPRQHKCQIQLNIDHSARALAVKELEMLEDLGKLGDESHLLVTHPMHEDAVHYQQESTVGDAKSYHPSGAQDSIPRRLQAWSYAAHQAAESTSHDISVHVEQGMALVTSAEMTLGDTQTLLSQKVPQYEGSEK